MENHTNKTYQERMNKTASSKFGAIEKYLDKGVKLLDFGSGFSPEFIEQVQQTGAHYVAYDVSQIVQNQLKEHDIDFLTKEQLANTEDEFDVIYLSSVFHELMSYLSRPERRETFAMIDKALKPDGVIVIRDWGYETNPNDITTLRYAACQAGAEPERFAKDPNPKFRAAVARNGDCLDILQHDDSPKVIYGVIKNGYNLEQFVHHPDELARRLTAHQVYMSDDTKLKETIYSQMYDDESSTVRATIADDGYYLEHYVTDESSFVRESVAKQGYALERLVNDPSEWVQMRVAEHGYGLEQLKDSPSALVRGMVAAQGYQPEVFVNDPDEEVAEVARPILAELEWERAHEVTLSTEDLEDLSSVETFTLN